MSEQQIHNWSWSRIQRTELALTAFVRMCDNKCAYHNVDHVYSMYQYLEDNNVTYDEALDWAVMFHDAVYDEKPDKELRSISYFLEMSEVECGCSDDLDKNRVAYLIEATINHSLISHPQAESIIRADLHQLTDTAQTMRNFVNIMDESLHLYGCSVKEFAEANTKFMAHLSTRMWQNMTISHDQAFWLDVNHGIKQTISMSQTISKRETS